MSAFNMGGKPIVDVLLVCAMKDEYDQVLNVSDGLLPPGWREQTAPAPNRWLVSMGEFDTMSGPLLCVVATHAVQMGREAASALAGRLLQHYPARCLAMSGVCAGRRGKVNLGDVIFGERLYSYDAGKATVEDGSAKFQSDPWLYSPPPAWIQRMQAISDSDKIGNPSWLASRPASSTDSSPFKVYVAPIASGASVQEDPQLFPRLAELMRKILGVEMEASALGALAQQYDIPALVAKGVQDYGDALKDDCYRTFAARASAECLRSGADLLPRREADIPAASLPVEPVGVPVLPLDLIDELADLYPGVAEARALWQRAGGRASQVRDYPNPRDLWQWLWKYSEQGATVRPWHLLDAALADHPHNTKLLSHRAKLK